MPATQHSQIAELIATHQARLHELELIQAAMGSATPPHVTMDIKLAVKAIEDLSGKPVEMTVREKHLIDEQWRMRYEGDLYKLERKIDGVTNLLHQLLRDLAIRALPPAPRPRPPRRVNGE